MRPSGWKIIRLVAAWGLGLYFAEMYVRNGWIKFDPNGFWTPAFVRWGYPPWMRIAVGVVETLGGAMLVIPVACQLRRARGRRGNDWGADHPPA